MKAYIDVMVYNEPQTRGGRNGGRGVTTVGQVLGRPVAQAFQRADGSLGTKQTVYANVHDEEGNLIGEIQVPWGSILQPLPPRVEVIAEPAGAVSRK